MAVSLRAATSRSVELLRSKGISRATLFRFRYVSTTSKRLSDDSAAQEENASTAECPSEPSPPQSEEEQRSSILSAALAFVPQMGWSQAALVRGVESLGLPPTSHGLFPRGAGELIEHFEETANSELIGFMKEEVERVEKSKFFRSALEYRLRAIIPYMDQWTQAMALKASPSNAPKALENLALMVDDIWYQAGDRSTDMNWYTKRGLMALIYTSSELYMVQDSSVDYQDTWNFLDRRLEDSMALTKVSRQVEKAVAGSGDLLLAGLTTLRNMVGMNSRNR